MFFLEREQERPLSVRITPGLTATRRGSAVIATADPNAPPRRRGVRLGLDMALDRSHPDWGRLMFLPLRRPHVEVTHQPGKVAETALTAQRVCWRVADIDATHAQRLQARGSTSRNPHRPEAGW